MNIIKVLAKSCLIAGNAMMSCNFRVRTKFYETMNLCIHLFTYLHIGKTMSFNKPRFYCNIHLQLCIPYLWIKVTEAYLRGEEGVTAAF